MVATRRSGRPCRMRPTPRCAAWVTSTEAGIHAHWPDVRRELGVARGCLVEVAARNAETRRFEETCNSLLDKNVFVGHRTRAAVADGSGPWSAKEADHECHRRSSAYGSGD